MVTILTVRYAIQNVLGLKVSVTVTLSWLNTLRGSHPHHHPNQQLTYPTHSIPIPNQLLPTQKINHHPSSITPTLHPILILIIIIIIRLNSILPTLPTCMMVWQAPMIPFESSLSIILNLTTIHHSRMIETSQVHPKPTQ